MNKKEKLAISEIKQVAQELGKEYGVKNIYLFGSYAKNQATNQSDVDLRIDKGKIFGLFALSAFRIALQKRLGKKVDLLTSDSLDKRFLHKIRSEEILLYAN